MIFNPFKKKQKKVLIIGLDGVPYSLLKRLIEKGKLPTLKEIFSKGNFSRITVTIPEISSVSWSSFMTGKDPSFHGIYGFTDILPGTYKMYFPNFLDLKAETIFDEIGKKGKRSVVINLPATYPAKKISGVLISGFVALRLEKAVFPKEILSKLKEFGYKIDVDTKRGKEDYDFLMKDLFSTLEKRRKVALWLWENQIWDLFMIVITGTDRIQHFLFDAFLDIDHPYSELFLKYFQKIDSFVAEMYEKYKKLPEEKTFFMLSDHGFTGIETEVYINRWLYENGYLKLSPSPKTISDIQEGTVAFALDPSRIYINLKGKFPLGKVEKKDYEKVREELKKGLLEMKYKRRSVIKKVFFKEDLFSGPYLEFAPDIVLLSNYGFDLKASVQKAHIFGRSNLTGMHTYDDAFFFCENKEIDCKTIFEAKEKIEKVLC